MRWQRAGGVTRGPLDMQALNDRAARVRTAVTLSSVIGRDVKLHRAGREMTGLCPFHDDRSLGSFMVNDAKGIYHCFSCGADGDVIRYVQERKGKSFMDTLRLLEADAGIDFSDAKARRTLDATRAQREKDAARDAARRRGEACHLWIYSSVPMAGTPAQSYLEGRGIDFAKLGRLPGAIRFKSDLYNKEAGRALPGMVTAIHDAGGKLCAVHRTWLERGPRGWVKARLDQPKMTLGSYYGGAMPLWKGDTRLPLAKAKAGAPIALSEGIEDALSVAMGAPELRVYAAISIDNMGNVALPPQAGDVTFLCQRDQDARTMAAARAMAAGDHEAAAHHEKAARQIAQALERAIGKQQARAVDDGSRRDVLTAWPGKGFKDWNDELRAIRMEAA